YKALRERSYFPGREAMGTASTRWPQLPQGRSTARKCRNRMSSWKARLDTVPLFLAYISVNQPGGKDAPPVAPATQTDFQLSFSERPRAQVPLRWLRVETSRLLQVAWD